MDKIRGENFGRIYVNFADMVSVAEKLHRLPVPNWNAPSFRFEIDENTKNNVKELASELVCKQQKGIITPISAVLLSILAVKELDLNQLSQQFTLLNRCLAKFATPCLIRGNVFNLIICITNRVFTIFKNLQNFCCFEYSWKRLFWILLDLIKALFLELIELFRAFCYLIPWSSYVYIW